MNEFSDYVVFDRPGGKKVRVVFELYRLEILFHYCELKYDDNSEWQSISRGDDGYCEFSETDSADGNKTRERVKFPTFEEIITAQDEINKKYNILSV